MLDRVTERRRAAQLARHYRDQEGLSIAEIARRLGRAEATIKAYLYDPTGENARAVKARYRGVCRGCGAPTAPRNGKGDAYAYCNAAIPARSRRNGHGNGFAKQCAHGERATALRRPPTTGRARTHAGAAAKRSNDYKPENGPRRPLSSICTGPGRRPAPTHSAAPERLGLNTVDTRTLACAWSSVNRAPKIAATLRPFVSSAAATRPSGPGDCWARGATATCACKPPRIGPPASTSTTLATAAKQARWPMPPAARAVSDAESPEFGETQVSCARRRLDLHSLDGATSAQVGEPAVESKAVDPDHEGVSRAAAANRLSELPRLSRRRGRLSPRTHTRDLLVVFVGVAMPRPLG